MEWDFLIYEAMKLELAASYAKKIHLGCGINVLKALFLMLISGTDVDFDIAIVL